MRALPFAYEIHPLSYTFLAQRRSVFMWDVTRYKNFSHHRAALTHTLTSIPVWLSYLADDVTARAVSPPDLAPPNLTSMQRRMPYHTSVAYDSPSIGHTNFGDEPNPRICHASSPLISTYRVMPTILENKLRRRARSCPLSDSVSCGRRCGQTLTFDPYIDG
ncbi:hypothetical protein BJV77DRAFT_255730 [Russula vinacea]|nr:hypothetical protein BJV77DRAFT_255730 [Russula vinacea]